MNTARTILLTGVSGYIGRRLATRMTAAGHRVVGLDRAALPAGVPVAEFVQADLLEPMRYRAALERCDAVFHLAAAKGDWGISRDEYYRDNLAATEALIAAAAAAGLRDWLFYSTVATLGPSEGPLTEDAPLAPANPYGASKAECELAFDRLAQRDPAVRILTIRPSVVFGPDHPRNTNIYRLIDSIARNRFVMIGDGRQIKTTSYIENLLDATMHLYARRLDGDAEWRGQDVYQCIDEPTISVADMVAHIRARLGKGRGKRLPPWLAAPLALVGDVGSALTGVDLPITSARIRKFCTATNFSAAKLQATGFRPRVTIADGLDRTIAWHQAR